MDKIPATYEVINGKVIITPTNPLDYNKKYKIVVSTDVKDIYGDELDVEDSSNNFATETTDPLAITSTVPLDTTDPLAITSTVPLDEATEVSINDNIEVTFNNEIDESTMTDENIWLEEVPEIIITGEMILSGPV